MFRYCPDFLAEDTAWRLFYLLGGEFTWARERLHLYGRTVTVPRLLAWSGDAGLNYRYAGADHVCTGWAEALLPLRRQVEAHAGQPFNLVLLNRYRTGADCMGWHTDDEPGLGTAVASLSLGAERRFLVRPPGGSAAGTVRSQRLDLAHGSLLLMDGSVPHALPRTRKPVDERINLTFRLLETGRS